ncbi:MAG: Lrp/AsnC family transcriptional regulator [Candidatus Heimdallarchaeota archaeon]|nr:Lrp/AsnC family transcriptional regulator [Candidatus Heimdallarchaeota archaeon]
MAKTKKALQSSNYKIDDLDVAILRALQEDSRTPVQLISEKVNTPASTIHYRLKRMKETSLIDGYYVKLNPTRLNLDYMTIIQVRTKESTKTYRKTGNELAKFKDIWAVYFTLGEWDFILLCRVKNRTSYLDLLEKIMHIEDVERTTSVIIAEVIKEDPRINL